MKKLKDSLLKLSVFTLFLTGYSTLFGQTTPAPVGVPVPLSTDTPHDYGKDPYSQKIKKRVISFGFFSLLNQHVSFGYDQLLGTDMVFSSQVGIIGPGITNNNTYAYSQKPTGAFAEAGFKLFFSPDFVTDGTHRYNTMQGGYFKPQVVLSSFNLTTTTSGYNQVPVSNTVNYTGLAILLNFGKQWILAGSVTLDMYVGIGYSVNAQSNIDIIYNYYSYESTGSALPLAFSAGLNLGVPF